MPDRNLVREEPRRVEALRDLPSGSLALHFAKFDHDAPRRRLALLTWSARDLAWKVERGSGSHGWTELHVLGEMLFGPSPWRRSCVCRVFGRLGSIEAMAAAKPAPGPSFEYAFAFELDPQSSVSRPKWRATYSPGAWHAVEAAYYERSE